VRRRAESLSRSLVERPGWHAVERRHAGHQRRTGAANMAFGYMSGVAVDLLRAQARAPASSAWPTGPPGRVHPARCTSNGCTIACAVGALLARPIVPCNAAARLGGFRACSGAPGGWPPLRGHPKVHPRRAGKRGSPSSRTRRSVASSGRSRRDSARRHFPATARPAAIGVGALPAPPGAISSFGLT
jgi:hypothetical protein